MSTVQHNGWLWTKREKGVSSDLISDSISLLVFCVELKRLTYHFEISKRLTSSTKHVTRSEHSQYNKTWIVPEFILKTVSCLKSQALSASFSFIISSSWRSTHHTLTAQQVSLTLLATSCAAPTLNKHRSVFVRHVPSLAFLFFKQIQTILKCCFLLLWLFGQQTAEKSGSHTHHLQRWPTEWDGSYCSKVVKLRNTQNS